MKTLLLKRIVFWGSVLISVLAFLSLSFYSSVEGMHTKKDTPIKENMDDSEEGEEGEEDKENDDDENEETVETLKNTEANKNTTETFMPAKTQTVTPQSESFGRETMWAAF